MDQHSEPHGDNTYNVTVPNQANNNMPTNEENKSNKLLPSLDVVEEEFYISFVPGQPNNLFEFPNGKGVLDDPLFHNNHSNIENEPNVGNTVTDVDNLN